MREQTCKACKSPLGENARFCKHCGAPVSTERRPFLSSPWFLIPGGMLLAAIVLFSGARMFLQLAAGAFLCEGFPISAGITVVISALAFTFGRLWAAHAAGLNDARYRRALWAAKTTGTRPSRRLARPVLLGVCLLVAAAAAAALLFKSTGAFESTQESAASAGNAESIAVLDAAAEEQAAAMTDEYDSLVKINGIWTLYTEETSGLNTLQRFVYFDDEQAVSGTCVAPEEVTTKLLGGSPLNEVTFDATYDYEVTAVSFIDARGTDEPYLASAEITFRDRSGTSEPFTATLDISRFLDFSASPGGAEKYAYPLLPYGDVAFTFDPVEVRQIATLPVPQLDLYGLWIAVDSMDEFSSFEVHSQADIPFLFFAVDTMYVGLCSSAQNARDMLLSPTDAAQICTILASYPITLENVTYALQPDSYIPKIDTCWITVQIDAMAATDVFMEEGSIIDWEGTTYQYSNNVEWNAPW